MRTEGVARRSTPVRSAPADRAELLTEAIVGERVEVVGERPGWLRVVVPSHGTSLDPRGYPGWVDDDAVVRVGWNPDLMIVAGNGAGLPLGALLEGYGRGARLPDGNEVRPDPEVLRRIGEADERTPVEVSTSLLGLPYRWGGTDSTAGMDCSGMVYRVMQLSGIAVPRDADDQFRSAPFKSRESWRSARVGDLVFFGEGSVTHVGFYLGGGTYVSEHGVGGTVVRGMEEDPYWGYARYARL